MIVKWTGKASDDLGRLHYFLYPVAPEAAARLVEALIAAPDKLIDFPRMGERMDREDGHEVRRLKVNKYEIHYEISGDFIFVVRIFHGREDRSVDHL
jgi:plasmid stabilization system protein ParE